MTEQYVRSALSGAGQVTPLIRLFDVFLGGTGKVPLRGVSSVGREIDFTLSDDPLEPRGDDMSDHALPPLPTTDLTVTPTGAEVEFFRENGFLVVERITTDEELDWLTELYEHIFDPTNQADPGAPVARDGTEGGANGESLLQQAFMPEFRFPELLRTVFNRNARTYAAALLEVDIDELSSWGHMIRKGPGGRAAPWHQDEAYWASELSYHALGAWLPLHEVTEEMGAMQFVRGSHRHGVYEHHPLNGDVELHLLVADVEIDPDDIVACPLPKGGATFHSQRTLHYTAPNQTDRPRLAFPTEFQVAPQRRTDAVLRPWDEAFRALGGEPGPVDQYPADGAMANVVG
jgi:ectoine hydroxylase-related dioxygenase (phytanoyl-CoA dioxygenase family)